MSGKFFNIVIIAILFLMTGCGSAVRFTSKRYKDNPPPVAEKEEIPVEQKEELLKSYNLAEALYEETGVASYYAHKFHGRITANGEVYDMYGLTAAHPTWPFETILRVTNLSNGKKVIIRVNDRMPRHPDRLIDLSLGTAQKLDMIQAGIQKVKLEVLKWGEE